MQNGTFEPSALVQFVLIQELERLLQEIASRSSPSPTNPHCEGRREWAISGWGHWALDTGQTSQHSTLATSPPQQGSGGPLHVFISNIPALFFMFHYNVYFCLRSRPVDPDVVR